MATLRKRGSRWQVQVRRTGFAPISKTFTTKVEAEAWGRSQEVECDTGSAPTQKSVRHLTVSELLSRYLNEITPRKRGKVAEACRIKTMLKDPIASLRVSDLSPAHVAAYRDRRLSSVSGPSVRRELTILRHCIEVARREWCMGIGRNPAAEVRRPADGKPRSRRPDHDELAALDQALRQRRNPLVRQVFLFALATGMRRGEVLGMTWEYIDWHHRTALLPLTKNGEARLVPLSPSALKVLGERQEACQRTPEGRLEPLVFPITANAFRLAWERVKRRAGVEDLRFHDLRHEAISRFFEMGLSVPEVALISGHRDVRMLLRYTHLKAQAVAEKLDIGEG